VSPRVCRVASTSWNRRDGQSGRGVWGRGRVRNSEIGRDPRGAGSGESLCDVPHFRQEVQRMGAMGGMTRVVSKRRCAAGRRLLALSALASCMAACGSTANGATGGGQGAGGSTGQSSGSSGGGSTSTSGSFVGTASNAAIFVQWTRSGGQLTGELQQALLDGSGSSEQVSSQSEAFTGTISAPTRVLLAQGLRKPAARSQCREGRFPQLSVSRRGARCDTSGFRRPKRRRGYLDSCEHPKLPLTRSRPVGRSVTGRFG
jgi:hypothetical protein